MNKLKFLFAALAIFALTATTQAQSFFKPIPKAKTATFKSRGIVPDAGTSDITFFALRPVMSAVTLYIDGDVQAAAGGGVSYQNITQRGSDGRNYVNYAINLIAAAGGSVTGSTEKSNIGKAAIYVSALNNTVGAGYGGSMYEDPVTKKNSWKGGLAIVWTYNFNN